MKAYILINVRAGKSPEVLTKLRQIKGVASAHACWGRPDLFAFVEASNEKTLADVVLDQIQKINGVEFTDTHLVID